MARNPEIRTTKNPRIPEGLIEKVEAAFLKAKAEFGKEREVGREYYCKCGKSCYHHKKEDVWYHKYSPLEFYSDYLVEQKDHEIEIVDGGVWVGKFK